MKSDKKSKLINPNLYILHLSHLIHEKLEDAGIFHAGKTLLPNLQTTCLFQLAFHLISLLGP